MDAGTLSKKDKHKAVKAAKVEPPPSTDDRTVTAQMGASDSSSMRHKRSNPKLRKSASRGSINFNSSIATTSTASASPALDVKKGRNLTHEMGQLKLASGLTRAASAALSDLNPPPTRPASPTPNVTNSAPTILASPAPNDDEPAWMKERPEVPNSMGANDIVGNIFQGWKWLVEVSTKTLESESGTPLAQKIETALGKLRKLTAVLGRAKANSEDHSFRNPRLYELQMKAGIVGRKIYNKATASEIIKAIEIIPEFVEEEYKKKGRKVILGVDTLERWIAMPWEIQLAMEAINK